MRTGILLMAAVVALWVPAGAQNRQVETYSLRRAIETALGNSQELDAAEAGLRLADQQVREAWATVLPDVRFSASYSRNFKIQEVFLPAIIFDPAADPNEVIPVRFGSDNSWQVAVDVSQPLFEATAFTGLGAAGQFREVELERVRGTAQQVVSAVRQAYFDALLAAENLRLINESVRRVGQTVEETRAMYRAGISSEYDVLRFEVQLSNIEVQVRRAENGVAASRRTLLVQLGLDPQTPIALLGELNEINLDDLAANDAANAELLRLAGAAGVEGSSSEELLSVARRYRTDLRQLRGAIDLDGALLAVERAEFYPRLSIFSNYQVLAQQNGGPNFFGNSNQRRTSAIAGLRVELPIFTGFSRFARVEQARATIRQSEARLDRAERESQSQVATLHENVLEARQRAASQRGAVRQAQRGYDIASAQFRAGVGTQLEVVDAELALRTSEFNYAEAVYDYLSARARLDQAIGTVPASLEDVPRLLGNEE